MRAYDELLSTDPAWPALETAVHRSGRAIILPPDATAARSCLERLQVTTRSLLGALAHETGGVLVDHGWLRVLGSGHARLPRALGQWNDVLAVPMTGYMLVADDIVGGAFAINGGGLGPAVGSVFYFSPDQLAWEDMQLGHSAFVQWTLEGDLAAFYDTMRWPGWETESEHVGGDQALALYPPPWTKEGEDLSRVSRRAVTAREVWSMQQDVARQLGSVGHAMP